MSHIAYDKKRFANAASPEWLVIGKQVGDLTNKYADRTDIVAFIGKGAGSGAPACFKPAIAEVELDIDVCFHKGVQASEITDLRVRKNQYDFPKAIGAIYHEAFHARFTTYSLLEAYETLNRDENDALHLLEEARIENFGTKVLPRSRGFLRSMVMDIVIGETLNDMEKQTGTKVLMTLLALVYSRVDLEILDEKEVQPVLDRIVSELGEARVEHLRAIARKFYSHKYHNQPEKLYEYAREWVEMKDEISKERGDSEPKEGQELSEELKKMLEEFKKMLEDAGVVISVGNFGELSDQELEEDFEDKAEQKNKEGEERQETKDVFDRVFNSRKGATLTSSRLIKTREANAKERSASLTISQMLEKAKYRERDHTVVASVTPPGRLRTRAIMQNKALRAQGQMAQETPFRKNVYKHTDEPTLSVGIMVDISGSMGGAMEPMASAAWIMAEAVRRIQGKCAMVYYGSSVFPTLRVGEKLEQVRVYSASDGTEEAETAFQALDGALDLQYGRGARLLVIVSDGHYRGDMQPKVKEFILRCEKAGVAILWIPFDNGAQARNLLGNYGEVVIDIDQPETASIAIGMACQRVLTRVGQRQIA